MALRLMSDAEMEGVLAHMDDSGTAGSKDKLRLKLKKRVRSLLGFE